MGVVLHQFELHWKLGWGVGDKDPGTVNRVIGLGVVGGYGDSDNGGDDNE